MKNFLSLIMAVCLCLSAFVFAGCNKSDGNGKDSAQGYKEKYNFEAYVDEDADILGAWEELLPEDSKSDKTVWRFEDSTTLNIVETIGGHSLTVGAAYNYNQKTKELSYMILDTKKEYKVKVSFDGEAMFFIDESGETFKSFER